MNQIRPILGQHWLIDPNILESIIKQARIEVEDTVLEIGTGKGHLTDRLLLIKANIISVEYDGQLYDENAIKYKNKANLQLIHADIRDYDWRKMPPNYKICANIPYYLTANLLRSLVDTDNQPALAVLLMQQEVALKLVHPTKRSLLSTLVQSKYAVKLGIEVPPEAFKPPPKVTSQTIILEPKLAFETLNKAQWPKLVRLLKICFATSRKQLKTNLKAGLNVTSEDIDQIAKKIDYPLTLRAEALTNQQWLQLFESFESNL